MTASFVYDGLGRQEKKTINGSLTEFLYDGLNPVQETSGATILANILPGLGIDEFLTRTDVVAGVTSHFLTDALGSPIAVTDNSGAVQTEYTYEPFGKTTFTGSSNSSSYPYIGRENDGTELYYYRARYYHAQFQRFISEDSFSGFQDIPISLNLYAYAFNSPLVLSDRDGHFPGPVGGIGGAIGGFIQGFADDGGFNGAVDGAIVGGVVGGLTGLLLGPYAGTVAGVAASRAFGDMLSPVGEGAIRQQRKITIATPTPIVEHLYNHASLWHVAELTPIGRAAQDMNVHRNVQAGGVRGVLAGLNPVATRRANRQDKALSELSIKVHSMTNTAGRKPVLKVRIPIWFQIVCGTGGIMVEVLLFFVVLQLWRHQSVDVFVPKGSVILFIIAMGWYAIWLVLIIVSRHVASERDSDTIFRYDINKIIRNTKSWHSDGPNVAG